MKHRGGKSQPPQPAVSEGGGVPICPHCGYDLENDAPITIGEARFDPARGFSFKDQRIHFSPAERIFVSTLMKAKGRLVTRAVLIERLDCDHVKEPDEYVRVYATRVRNILRASGAPILFATDWGSGFYWLMPAMSEAA